MNASFATGFREELQKVGFAIPPAALSVGVPVAIGTALSGLALYDYLKGKKLDPKLTKEFITGKKGEEVTARKAIKELLEERPLIRPVVPVTTSKAVEKMVKDPKFGFFTRSILEEQANKIVNKAVNAAVIQGEDKDYVVIPKKVHPSVVEHEVGHLQDFARKIENPGFIRRLFSLVWKPEYDKQVLERERRAWNYAKKTPKREKALASYESGFHRSRSGLARTGAIVAFLNALKNIPAGGP